MRGAIAAGHPLTAEAGARILREGGNAVDAVARRCFHGFRHGRPADGPDRRRLRARPRAERLHHDARLLLRRPDNEARRDGGARHRLRRCRHAGVPRRRRLRRGAGPPGGPRGDPRPLRDPRLGGPRRAGGPPRREGLRARRAARDAAPDPGGDPPARRRWEAHLRRSCACSHAGCLRNARSRP